MARILTVVGARPQSKRTRGRIAAEGLEALTENLSLLEPQGCFKMVRLERDAAVVATEPGGVQKGVFFHRVPCVTLRDEAGWTELIEADRNQLAPRDGGGAVAAAILSARGTRGSDVTTYSDGDAADKIVARLLRS